jgi:hypothetical protein
VLVAPVLFLAQFFGVPHTWGSRSASRGSASWRGEAAGVSAGSIRAVAMILQMCGIPLNGLGPASSSV